ncbi:hypothetical protein [Candidatus Tisiphia endosymbiont of Hybos culiciformis]|uniref:hypothetical protein n=1 Tax=Candidatus Tisiphia endosymbiont of Hybos culiciformis TaxID=3139331 RepID=UPI003CCADBB5
MSKDKRTREEIFNDLASAIRNSHDQEISEQESRKLARNFIRFSQRFIEIQLRIDKEKELARKDCD